MALYEKTAVELSALLRAGEVSACEITEATLARIDAAEPEIGAFLSVTAELARVKAAEVDKKRARGEALGALAGIPVGIKDNICVRGEKTTCASRMLENYISPYSATVIEKLTEEDAVIPGKLNMDEFAMGSTCENSAFHLTKNPWDTERVPGGSSGGSAACVGACEVPLSLGSDTGGSIRCPAALCGVVGLKPTYGAVSRFGLVALAPSLDQIGPLGRTVDDVSLLFRVICGRDTKDPSSKSGSFQEMPPDVRGMRIGILQECFDAPVKAGTRTVVLQAMEMLCALGAQSIEISVPSVRYALYVYKIISSAQAASHLARFDGIRYGKTGKNAGNLEERCRAARSQGFGEEVQRRILLGTYVLSDEGRRYYEQAKQAQSRIVWEFADAFQKCDILLTPTTPATAARLNDEQAGADSDFCAAAVSLAGLPGVSVPCGFDASGLPVGMQLIGPSFSEARLLSAAKAYETAVNGFAVRKVCNESDI